MSKHIDKNTTLLWGHRLMHVDIPRTARYTNLYAARRRGGADIRERKATARTEKQAEETPSPQEAQERQTRESSPRFINYYCLNYGHPRAPPSTVALAGGSTAAAGERRGGTERNERVREHRRGRSR